MSGRGGSFGASLSGTASPRCTAARIASPLRLSANPRVRPRHCASASAVSGTCAAISTMFSSFSTRLRGTSRLCASRSRQAATSFNTARKRGFSERVFSRFQAFSGLNS